MKSERWRSSRIERFEDVSVEKKPEESWRSHLQCQINIYQIITIRWVRESVRDELRKNKTREVTSSWMTWRCSHFSSAASFMPTIFWRFWLTTHLKKTNRNSPLIASYPSTQKEKEQLNIYYYIIYIINVIY